jgi:predicted GNAT family acetyltransferase
MPPHSELPEIVVRDNPEKNRYEAMLGPAVAAFVDYRVLRERIVLIHTEVERAYTGRGVGRRLAQGVLDDIRARGLKVTPICPFMAAFIERHPAYADLVSWGRERAG